MKPEVNVWRRVAGEDRHELDPREYQADIYFGGADYHGLGNTQAEALLNAAEFWYVQEAHKREKIGAPDRA